MVKPRRNIASSSYYYYSEKTPQFFKVYLPDHCSQRLKIPQAFIKYFKGVIPFKSILKSTSKRSWRINVKKVEDHFVFDQGWPAFVKDNSLQFKDFLIFSYNENSEFHVVVFGQNNCQKEVAITVENDKPEETSCQENKDQITWRILQSSMQLKEDNGVLETPCNFDSENPFFENLLKPTYVHGHFMNIPLEFVMKYMRKDTPTAMLKLVDKSWSVNLTRHLRTYRFGAGWSKFAVDSNLKEGDTCRFELIPSDGCYVFNVSILNAKSKESRGMNKTVRVTKKSGCPREQPAIKEKVGVFEDLSKFISKHPFFKTVLAPAYVHKAYMHIPSDFWHRYMDKCTERANLEYSNKLWEVNLYCHSKKLMFCGGWKKFVTENSLQAGNVCFFELIEREKHVFRVSVRRS